MPTNQFDSFGVYGDILRFSVLFALIGGAVLIFLYLWIQGRLDMDEEPKKTMLEADEHNPT